MADHHLVVVLSRVHVDPITDQERCRVAQPHLDGPVLGQGVRPGGRLAKRRHRPVAVRPAPLRPLLTRGNGHDECRNRHDDQPRQCSMLHVRQSSRSLSSGTSDDYTGDRNPTIATVIASPTV